MLTCRAPYFVLFCFVLVHLESPARGPVAVPSKLSASLAPAGAEEVLLLGEAYTIQRRANIPQFSGAESCLDSLEKAQHAFGSASCARLARERQRLPLQVDHQVDDVPCKAPILGSNLAALELNKAPAAFEELTRRTFGATAKRLEDKHPKRKAAWTQNG